MLTIAWRPGTVRCWVVLFMPAGIVVGRYLTREDAQAAIAHTLKRS